MIQEIDDMIGSMASTIVPQVAQKEASISLKGLMLHGDSQTLGDAGEYFIREFLQEKGLTLERMEKRAPNLPDFKIRGMPILVEVKSHNRNKPVIWQKLEFMRMVGMGWRIFIAHPRLKMRNDMITCERIDWYEFLKDGRIRAVRDLF